MNLTTLRTHVRTQKHSAGKKKRESSKLKEVQIAAMLKKQDASLHAAGEMLPEEERIFRMQVVEGFLTSGIPIYKLATPQLRSLLERGGHRLTHCSHLARLIPSILAMEMQRLHEDLAFSSATHLQSSSQTRVSSRVSRNVSVIFDGSTRLGEAIVIVFRFVDDDWRIQQRLVRIDVVAKSVTAVDLSRVLMDCLFTRFQLEGSRVLAIMRDGASVNGAALNLLRPFLPKMMDIICFSHMLDNVGRHFDCPVLDKFGQHWVRLLSASCRAKLAWKTLTGRTPKTYSETRWWSRWEVYNELLQHFGDVRPLLDVAPKVMDHLRVIIDDPEQLCRLKLELAAVIDVGSHFVTATYDLEGDSALALCCFQRLQAVANSCQVDIAEMHFPNLHAVAVNLAESFDHITIDWAEDYGRRSVRDAVRWFMHKFNVELIDIVRAFKAARLLCPATVCSLAPTAASVQTLRVFPFLDDDGLINGLCQELPQYVAHADGVSITGNNIADVAAKKLQWCRDHSNDLPQWSSAARMVVLVQPSSAAAERVFSLLQSAFGDLQQAALTDYLEASVMLRYNNRGDK